MRSQVLRLSAATFLLGAAATTIWPHMTNYISSSAIVNAPLLTVRAPFAGRVVTSSPAFASPVRTGQQLLQLDGERQDQDAVTAVQAEAESTRAQVTALIAQIAAVTEVEAELRSRIAAHDQASELYLAVQRQRLQAKLERAQADRDQAAAERDRMAQLVATGAAPETALDDALSLDRTAHLNAEEIAAEIRGLDLEATSLAQGIALDGSIDGGTAARQRLDEVRLDLAELTSRRDTLQGRLGALEKQAAAIGADFVRRTTFAPEAAGAAVIWRAAPANGTSVMAGDILVELLDCENRFVEVALPARLFENIRPGDPATIRLKGATDPIDATVEAVGGAGARFDHPNLASDPADIDSSDIQVLVRIGPADLSRTEVAASLCDVGRTAEVRFRRKGSAVIDVLVAAAGVVEDWAGRLLPGSQGIDPTDDREAA